MHISHLLERYLSQLSGGQRQRVAVARALAVEPDVLLMDEPLSNLDALLRLEMRAELKHLLAESRTTTIYVTHDQVEAMSLADRIAVMRGGDIVQIDEPMIVYGHLTDTFVGGFIGNPPMNFIKVPRRNGRAQLGSLDLATPETRGETITLGVRPEEPEPAPDGQGFAANVMVAEPLGPHVLLTLTYDGQQVRYTAPAGITAKPGDVLPEADAGRPALARQRDRLRPELTTEDRMTEFIERARAILRDNDLGGYTVPTKRLYPFQWNWDSGLRGPGLFHLRRAARLAGARHALSRPVGGRARAAHRLPQSEPRLLPAGPLGRRPQAADLRHHAAPGRRLDRPPPPGRRARPIPRRRAGEDALSEASRLSSLVVAGPRSRRIPASR